MKNFLKSVGQKVAQAADSLSAYNLDGSVAAGQSKGLGGTTVKMTAGLPNTAETSGPPNPQDPGVIEHLIRHERSPHVRSVFFGLAKQPTFAYTETKDVRVMVGSYNVNGKPPPPDLDVGAWLGLWQGEWPPGSVVDDKQQPDVIALGFQEVVPLNAGNVIVGSATANLTGWDRAVGAYLNGEAWANSTYGISTNDQAGVVMDALQTNWSGSAPTANSQPATAANNGPVGGGWVQIAARQLVGNYLSVWVRRVLLPHIRGVQAVHIATGFGGYLGNKGAVVVRMRIFDQPLVLISSHLSAGDQEGDELNHFTG